MEDMSEIMVNAFDKLFEDHKELNDFIFERNGIGIKLDEISEQARNGKYKANDLPTIWISKYCQGMEDELRELKESLSWKWWKGQSSDLQNARVELVDLFHFLLSAIMASGMNGSDFIKIYYEKRKLNFDRQDIGFHRDDNKNRNIGVL